MRMFSLECSTPGASAALLDGETVIRRIAWHEERARHEGLFELTKAMMSDAGWSWNDINLFCVGRGPGAYSGLRVSLLAVQSLAEPGKTPVMAVSSMDALALDLCRAHNLESISLIGDARRQSCWVGHCRAETIPATPTEWAVIPLESLDRYLSPTDPIATPHGDAMTPIRERYPMYSWLDGVHRPDAEMVARLTLKRLNLRIASEPLLPLYLHPAV